MKKTSVLLIVFIALTLSTSVTSCSNDGELAKEEIKTKDFNLKTFENYGKGLDELSFNFVKMRSVIFNASDVEREKTINTQGELVIKNLLPITNTLFQELHISDRDFEDAIAELKEEGEDVTNIRIDALKCYSALALYDTFLFDNSLNKRPTRADYLDYASCIGLGTTVKGLADWSTAQIAKFLAKKAIGRAVPYIGWGWAIISGYECIKKLK